MPVMPAPDTPFSDAVPPLPFLQMARGLPLGARNRKLKEGDVLVAFDGEMFNGDVEMLRARQGAAKAAKADEDEGEREPMTPHLLTFWREGHFFHIIFDTPLVSGFEACPAEIAQQIIPAFARMKYAPLETYRNFEFFRDVRKNAALHACEPESLPKYAPFLWMMNHRLYYPMVAVGVVHVLTFLSHWSLFALTYLLLAVYTNRAQLSLLRSYKLFEDKFFWMVLAEPNEVAARNTCKALAPDVKLTSERAAKPVRPAHNPHRVRAARKSGGFGRNNSA